MWGIFKVFRRRPGLRDAYANSDRYVYRGYGNFGGIPPTYDEYVEAYARANACHHSHSYAPSAHDEDAGLYEPSANPAGETPQEMHEMTAQSYDSSGKILWKCTKCSRTMVLGGRAGYYRLVLDEGDSSIGHFGSSGGAKLFGGIESDGTDQASS